MGTCHITASAFSVFSALIFTQLRGANRLWCFTPGASCRHTIPSAEISGWVPGRGIYVQAVLGHAGVVVK